MKSKLNTWVLTKIASFLSVNEGFIIEETEETKKGLKSIVRDAMGYRYEIHVETLSRIYEDYENDILVDDKVLKID